MTGFYTETCRGCNGSGKEWYQAGDGEFHQTTCQQCQGSGQQSTAQEQQGDSRQ